MTADPVEKIPETKPPEDTNTPSSRPEVSGNDVSTPRVKFLHCSVRVPWTNRRIPYWPIWIVSLIVGYILGSVFDPDWSAIQWGTVAAWISGLLTVGAITASLRQLRIQRSDAAEKELRDDIDRSIESLLKAAGTLVAEVHGYHELLEINKQHPETFSRKDVHDCKVSLREKLNEATFDAALALISLQDHKLHQPAWRVVEAITNTRSKIFSIREPDNSPDWDAAAESTPALMSETTSFLHEIEQYRLTIKRLDGRLRA